MSEISEIESRKATLDLSIAGTYQIFMPYEFTDRVGDVAFPGFCDPVEMLAYPLDQVPAKAIERYSWKALSTWGTVDDLKHFLPRLLELAIAKSSVNELIDPVTVFGKLRYARWPSWPEREQNTIAEFLHALWAYVIALPPDAVANLTSFSDANDCLDAIDRATDEITPFLDQWLNDATTSDIRANAAAQIALTVLDSSERLSLKGTANRHGHAFDRWLQSKKLAECLAKAYLENPESKYAGDISDAEAFVRMRVTTRQP